MGIEAGKQTGLTGRDPGGLMMLQKAAFCDLDNTIIFSHRKEIGEKVLVEMLRGKNQAYMTRRGYDLLQVIPRNAFIPVTSRREEQYRRISFFKDGTVPAYALIDNGGILLLNGERDTEWLEESYRIVGEDTDRLIKMQHFFSGVLETKLQDQLILFLKPGELADEVKACADGEGLMTFHHSDKMYVCSGKLTKGNAVRRFLARFPVGCVLAAGDSEIDESMIDAADRAFMSKDLERKSWEGKDVRYIDPVDISENVFAELADSKR